MTKKDMIIRLHKASQLLKEVEDSMVNHLDIDAQYCIDVNQAKDICIDFGSYLQEIINKRGQSDD